MTYLVYQILKLKPFLLWTAAAGLFLMVLFLVLGARPKRGPVHYGMQSFFFQLTMRETVYLSVAILQLLFVVSAVVSQTTVERIHLYMIAAFCIVKFLSRPGAASLVTDAVYSVFIAVLLLVCNLFGGFLNQSAADIWLTGMYVFLNLLAAELAIWYFMRCLRTLTKERGKANFTLSGFAGKFVHRRVQSAAEEDLDGEERSGE